ncbi:hypothetical protein Tco_0192474 [Tanacetum coccineum]
MVWSGYAVLMYGRTDSIKLNNNPGCLPGSTFVYSEVFKLDLSSASLHSISCTLMCPWKRISDKRTKNEAKNDKTKHEIEEHKKSKSKSKSTIKSQSQTEAETEEMINGPTRTHLMSRAAH